ncbi:hypothetical protein RUM44_008550 [Polyplax serrata]|uniref:Uncharacterized protein n=1 Tax=Polyplax serrata TaxID=468196 RepID=A0ABR1BD13_POLSC
MSVKFNQSKGGTYELVGTSFEEEYTHSQKFSECLVLPGGEKKLWRMLDEVKRWLKFMKETHKCESKRGPQCEVKNLHVFLSCTDHITASFAHHALPPPPPHPPSLLFVFCKMIFFSSATPRILSPSRAQPLRSFHFPGNKFDLKCDELAKDKRNQQQTGVNGSNDMLKQEISCWSCFTCKQAFGG